MKLVKRITSLLLVVVVLVGTQKSSNVYAANEYLETTYQINFTDLNVQVTDDNKLSFETKSGLKRNRSRMMNSSIGTLERIIEEFPDVETILIDNIQKGDLKAVSFTEVPLTYVDDHYERVSASKARSYEGSAQNGKGKFLMWTSIIGGNNSAGSGYEYLATTYGTWSKNNIIGGSNYPAAGTDYVLQACPKTFSRVSDTFSAYYDNGAEGVNGEEFWRENGDSFYVRYAIEDDPFGIVQNSSFYLSTTSIAPKSNEVRQIASYYVHTWKQMSLSVSLELCTDKSATLSLTPSIVDKSWQVYNYVSFDF